MPRPRVSELSQKQAPRLRTSSSSTSILNHPNRLTTTDRSSKLSRSHSDPLGQKKFKGRISDLESQLVQAQEELRLLKEQLANGETVKKQPRVNTSKKPNHLALVEESAFESNTIDKETDVFEVPIEPKNGNGEGEGLAVKEEEIKMLKARLYVMEKEHESLGKENEGLKSKLSESNTKANEEEMSRMEEELEESRAKTANLKEKLESMGVAKDALEAEMKRLRVQTEQWKKAADAAAAVLSGESEMNRSGSSEKCLFDPTAAIGFIEPLDDTDDGLGSGKRKSSGMKILGELWKKKGQK